jgi:hypothetical protein
MTHTHPTPGGCQGMVSDRSTTGITAPWAWLMGKLRQLDARLLGRPVQEPQTDEDVLAWARRMAGTEPRFAAELHAAVLRKQALEA